jgi:hypothetical protein
MLLSKQWKSNTRNVSCLVHATNRSSSLLHSNRKRSPFPLLLLWSGGMLPLMRTMRATTSIVIALMIKLVVTRLVFVAECTRTPFQKCYRTFFPGIGITNATTLWPNYESLFAFRNFPLRRIALVLTMSFNVLSIELLNEARNRKHNYSAVKCFKMSSFSSSCKCYKGVDLTSVNQSHTFTPVLAKNTLCSVI